MSNEIEGLTQFGDEGAVETPEAGDQGEGAADAGDQGQPEQREPQTRNTREWPSDGSRPRGADGKFQGANPGAPAEKPKAPEAKQPVTQPAPERRKFRVPKDDGSGHEELLLTDDEVAQRVADARRLSADIAREREERAQQEREALGIQRFVKDLKGGKSREQALLGLMRSTGLSEEECEDVLVQALHGYVVDGELTPEQRRLKELEEYRAQQEEKQQRAQADAEHQQFVEKTNRKAEEYAKTWKEALDMTGWPATPEMLADIGREHLLNRKRGINLTPAELASFVTQKHDRALGMRLKDLPAEEFAKRFPDAAKGWQERMDAMEPADFAKAHPSLAKKMLVYFREMVRTKKGGAPGVGATRPAPRPAPAPRQAEDDAPRFYDPHEPASAFSGR